MTLASEMTNAFSEVYSLMKESVTYRTVSRSYNTNDDLIETNSDTTVNVVVEILDLESVNDIGGLLNVGDMIIYFLGTQTVNQEDKIVHNSIVYSIEKVIPHNTGSTVNYYETHCKRVHS